MIECITKTPLMSKTYISKEQWCCNVYDHYVQFFIDNFKCFHDIAKHSSLIVEIVRYMLEDYMLTVDPLQEERIIVVNSEILSADLSLLCKQKEPEDPSKPVKIGKMSKKEFESIIATNYGHGKTIEECKRIAQEEERARLIPPKKKTFIEIIFNILKNRMNNLKTGQRRVFRTGEMSWFLSERGVETAEECIIEVFTYFSDMFRAKSHTEVVKEGSENAPSVPIKVTNELPRLHGDEITVSSVPGCGWLAEEIEEAPITVKHYNFRSHQMSLSHKLRKDGVFKKASYPVAGEEAIDDDDAKKAVISIKPPNPIGKKTFDKKIIKKFVDECCVKHPGSIACSDLYKEYHEWCTAKHCELLTKERFRKVIKPYLGNPVRHTSTQQWYYNGHIFRRDMPKPTRKFKVVIKNKDDLEKQTQNEEISSQNRDSL